MSSRPGDSGFIWYFTSTKEFRASNPSDKLFALFHISKDTRDIVITNALVRPDYEKSVERVIVDFSRAKFYLPLCVKVLFPGTEQPPAVGIQENQNPESSFYFNFYYRSHYEAVMPLVQDHSYHARGIVSRIRTDLHLSLELLVARDDDSTSLIAWATQCIRQLIKVCKPHLQETNDMSFYQNLLRMLDIHESDTPIWMVFGKICLSDVLSDWSEVSQVDFLDELRRFSNAWYFQDVPFEIEMSSRSGSSSKY